MHHRAFTERIRRAAIPLRLRVVSIALGLLLVSLIPGQGQPASAGGPNLVVQNILITDVPTGDGNSLLNVVETFKNQGEAESLAVQVREAMNGQSVGQFQLPALKPGKSHTRVTSATATSGSSVTWEVMWDGGQSSVNHNVK